jgi:non-specific serine/threonine protein kinase
VHFNLAENRRDDQSPFAFLATYTTRLSSHAKAQHLPLGQALREYASATSKERLLSLLLPVQRAAEMCPWLKAMVDSGEIFHPLRWKPSDAFRFLHDVPQLESAGVVVRMPATWRANRPSRPQVKATVGGKAPSVLGKDALLDFRMDVTLDGELLTAAEIKELLAKSDGLSLVRGRWVEVDRERLGRMLEHFQMVERAAAASGLGFGEAMRMLAGADVAADGGGADPDWAQVIAGPWLLETLKGLRGPEGLACVDPGAALNGTLRPYQQVGMRWLYLLSKLGLGGCLADDMGLGKTIQVLALLLVLRSPTTEVAPGFSPAPSDAFPADCAALKDGATMAGTALKDGTTTSDTGRLPSLLVAPASLLANWAAELNRFAPSLKALVAHPSAIPASDLKALAPERLGDVDLVITSYGSLLRIPWLTETSWRLVALDEAQAIKNPEAKQTRAAKKLNAQVRFALTGTPVENRLGDLWSIFDFTNPGLLGSSKEFTRLVKNLAEKPHNPYGPLRELVRPYILRRLKTDKTVIADLPDKTEVKAFCQLSRQQAALYHLNPAHLVVG